MIKAKNVFIPSLDDSKYPVKAGPNPDYSVLRTPSFTYKNFGVDGPAYLLRPLSNMQYTNEWIGGDNEQMTTMVRESAKRSLGDCPGLLYQTGRKVLPVAVQYFLDRGAKKVNITETGFGNSTVQNFEGLMEANISPDKVHLIGIEPSAKRVEAVSEKLKGMGLKEGSDGHFETRVGTDVEHLPYLADTQHIVTSTATEHHNAYLDAPLGFTYRSLVNGGICIVNEWLEPMCMHPFLEYRFLESLNADKYKWKTKGTDLQTYRETHPNWNDIRFVRGLSEPALVSSAMINAFWEAGWASVRNEEMKKGNFNPGNEIFYREAHGTRDLWKHAMNRAGFKFHTVGLDGITAKAGLSGSIHRITSKAEMDRIGMTEKVNGYIRQYGYSEFLPKGVTEKGSDILTTFIGHKVEVEK